MNAGSVLTSIRKEMGLKSAQFAKLVGASPGQMHDWENGRQKLTVEAAARIERAINRSGVVEAVVEQRAQVE